MLIAAEGVLLAFIKYFHYAIFALFLLLYGIQWLYLFVGLCFPNRTLKHPDVAPHKLAVITSARNESKVIAQMIDSVRKQNYPAELVDIIVIADNCTDNTAEVARAAGALVIERNNTELVGKGYALEYCFDKLYNDAQFADKQYDAYVVLDADNLLSPDYLHEMNRVYGNGFDVVTSYRNTKNYKNWISGGYGLWFLREARYLNGARFKLHNSCAVSGTGFLIADNVVREMGGWPYHLLTEDLEFTSEYILKGKKIGYARNAEFFDEQPEKFTQSWRQRMRWARGYYQVLGKTSGRMTKGLFGKNGPSCFDMLTTLLPAIFVSLVTVGVDVALLIAALILRDAQVAQLVGIEFGKTVLGYYIPFFVVGFFTTVTEWKRIRAPWHRKIFNMFTFPLFMYTYVPIAFAALFKRVEWKQVTHNRSVTIDELIRTAPPQDELPAVQVTALSQETVSTENPLASDKTPPHIRLTDDDEEGDEDYDGLDTTPPQKKTTTLFATSDK